jgi:para-aminobenzoate synthetase/4-amino-4-deoxychorismate lyase
VIRRIQLDGVYSVGEVLRGFRADRNVVCLRGKWAGGGALIASEPIAVADDPAVLHREAPGWWFSLLGYRGAWLGLYDHLLHWDGTDWYFEYVPNPDRADEIVRRQQLLTDRIGAPAHYRAGEFAGAEPDPHLQAIERCMTHIRAGDIFQVNVALRLQAEFTGSAVDLFSDVADRLQPAYASYVDTGNSILAGFSPELFLRRAGRTVTTSPIKGTRPRVGRDDAREAEILRNSTKDAAENVMIVDLMRNDLGRVCAPDTVTVPKLLEIQQHPGVWHLVSTVTGELPDAKNDADLLDATFPPGSVTGAPKSRAMELIDEHERHERAAFSGSVGISGPEYGAEFNVVIRSFEISGDRISLWAGGGITVDSVPIEEWRECLTKADPVLTAAGFRLAPISYATPDAVVPDISAGLLETVLVRDGQPVALADHLARLERSCREVYGWAPPPDLAARVAAAAAGHDRARLRIVASDGELAVTVSPLIGPTGIDRLVSVQRPAGIWRHKYADRNYFELAEKRTGDALPLFTDGEFALETSRGNVFAVENDALITPPLTDAILPGITRRLILDAAFDIGVPVLIEPLSLDRIHSCDGLFTTSAISELTHIRRLDDKPLPPAGEIELALITA